MGQRNTSAAPWRRLFAVMQLLVVTFVAAMLVAGAAVAGIRTLPGPTSALDTILGDSPDLRGAVRNGLSEPSRVVAADGSVIGRFRPEERFVAMTPEDIPDVVLRAVLAAEDSSFLQHAGIDAEAIIRASLANLEGGAVEQGGRQSRSSSSRTCSPAVTRLCTGSSMRRRSLCSSSAITPSARSSLRTSTPCSSAKVPWVSELRLARTSASLSRS